MEGESGLVCLSQDSLVEGIYNLCMVEVSVETKLSEERLKKWLKEANYEVLPTVKALELVSIIPQSNRVSVTCRPTGIEDTLGFIEALGKERTGRVTPHIAAGRILSEAHFEEVVKRLLKSGTKRALVVGGDGEPFGREFTKAEDVLRGFYGRGVSFERIGVGGYPDGNPSFKLDPVEVLLRKQAWAEETQTEMEVLTQICFDVDTILNWIGEIRDRGVSLPVVVGVPGRLRPETVVTVLRLLGVHDIWSFFKSKPRLALAMTRATLSGFSPEEMLKELAEKSGTELGISGINIYTLGNITGSVQALRDLT